MELEVRNLIKLAETNWHQQGTPDDKSSTVDYPLADFDGDSIVIPGTNPPPPDPHFVTDVFKTTRKPEQKVKPMEKKALEVPDIFMKHPRAWAAGGMGAISAYSAAKAHNMHKAFATVAGAGIGAVAGDLIDARATNLNRQVMSRLGNIEESVKTLSKSGALNLKELATKINNVVRTYHVAASEGIMNEATKPLGAIDPLSNTVVGAAKGTLKQGMKDVRKLTMKKHAGIGELLSDAVNSGTFKKVTGAILKNPKVTMALGGAAIGAAAGAPGHHPLEGAAIGATGGYIGAEGLSRLVKNKGTAEAAQKVYAMGPETPKALLAAPTSGSVLNATSNGKSVGSILTGAKFAALKK